MVEKAEVAEVVEGEEEETGRRPAPSSTLRTLESISKESMVQTL